MLELPLYTLVLRALLNEECHNQQQELVQANGKKLKPGKIRTNRRNSDGLELAEKLQELAGNGIGIGTEEQARLIDENQNWLTYQLSISIESEDRQNGYLLQIASGVEREEHFLSMNNGPLQITLPHGRRSMLRLFPMEEHERLNEQQHQLAADNSHFYRRSHSPESGSSRLLQPSSTSSSTPSLASNEERQHFGGFNSFASKSGSFLRKLTTYRSGPRRRVPVLTVRFRNLPANQQHHLAIPGNPRATLSFYLQKRPAQPESGEFQPMEISEYVQLLRTFKAIFIQKWTESENSHNNLENECQSDLTMAFQYFNKMTESTQSLRHTLDEIIRRVAHFNDFSALTQILLEIGISLEGTQFGNINLINNRSMERQNELAREAIGRHLERLKDERIENEQELKAAIFLAERLSELLAEVAKTAKRQTLFLPDLMAESKEKPLGQRLSSHLVKLEKFIGQIDPLLNLLQSPIWEHPGVSGLSTSVTTFFEHSIQQQIAEFIRREIDSSQKDLDSFGDLVDSLRIFMGHTFGHTIERFFERISISFFANLVQALDDPLSHACQTLLKDKILSLDPKNSEQAVQFTKDSMQLFDALREFADTSIQFGAYFSLYQFESWFEKAAVYWTGTWRAVYVEFIKKCVHENSPSNDAAISSASKLPNSASMSALQNRRSSIFLPDPFCSSPSPPSSPIPRHSFPRCGSRQFNVADFQHQNLQMHEATVNCLAFCKALCDDFLRLKAKNREIVTICTLQSCSILADCLDTFCSLLYQQVKVRPTFAKMLRAANSIEHASAYLTQNFERFLEMPKLADLENFNVDDLHQILTSCRRIVGAARTRCRTAADQIAESLCERKIFRLRHYCALVTQNWADLNNKKPLRFYLRQMFSPINERADQILIFFDKACAHLHTTLLPRLYSTARLALWQLVRRILEEQLLKGQQPEYYMQIENACESICHILQLNWAGERCSLRRVLCANRASTKELILQYYSHLADQTANDCQRRPTAPVPRISVRIGYIRTTGQQVLLQIHVLSAWDVPVLDSLTNSSDPYLRLELLPRFLFPLSQFPAQNTETKKQTLNPKWNQVFQIAVPEELFFMNGACICLTVLDHDVMSYNDLAGQAYLPLATIARLNELSARKMPTPLVLPLKMPSSAQYSIEAFQILEQRSAQKDELAREMTSYEKYLRDYHILPPCAQDENEWTLKGEMRRGKERIQQLLGRRGGSLRW